MVRSFAPGSFGALSNWACQTASAEDFALGCPLGTARKDFDFFTLPASFSIVVPLRKLKLYSDTRRNIFLIRMFEVCDLVDLICKVIERLGHIASGQNHFNVLRFVAQYLCDRSGRHQTERHSDVYLVADHDVEIAGFDRFTGCFEAGLRALYVFGFGVFGIDKAIEPILFYVKLRQAFANEHLSVKWIALHELDYFDSMVVADSSKREPQRSGGLALAGARIDHHQSNRTLIRTLLLPGMGGFIVFLNHIRLFAAPRSAAFGLCRHFTKPPSVWSP